MRRSTHYAEFQASLEDLVATMLEGLWANYTEFKGLSVRKKSFDKPFSDVLSYYKDTSLGKLKSL